MRTTFTLGAFGVIKDEQGRVLLGLRNDYDFWNLPGGGIEAGESPRDAVVREVKEETGLDVSVDKLVGIYSKGYSNDLVFLFTCKVVSGELCLNEEAKDLRYFSLTDFPKNTPPKHIERIQDSVHPELFPFLKIQGKDDFKYLVQNNFLH